MSKRQIIMLLGLLVILLPLSGLTSFWDTISQFVFGILIIFFAYQIRIETISNIIDKDKTGETKKTNDPNLPFVDNKSPSVDISQNRPENVIDNSNLIN